MISPMLAKKEKGTTLRANSADVWARQKNASALLLKHNDIAHLRATKGVPAFQLNEFLAPRFGAKPL
jgi:hypothetical protein